MRADWLFTRSTRQTLAQNLTTRQQVELSGELHEALPHGGALLRALSAVDPTFFELASALEQPPRPLTFDALLRGSGWRILFIELTGRCNENCLHCYAQSSPEVTAQLEWETVERVLLDAKELGFTRVQFTGGDPLISPHIERAVEMASELGFPTIEVYTNALALHEPLLELFAQKNVSIAVSLYSHRSDVHDAVTRTPGSHDRTSRAIRAALARGISVRIGGVQGVAEGQDEVALRAYIRELGVPEGRVTVDRQRPVGRGTWQEETKLESEGPSRTHQTEGDRDGGKLCVTYNGDVVPCIFDRSSVIGNVSTATLSSVLGREIKARTAPSPLRVVGQPLACVECRFRNQLLQGTLPGAPSCS
jgi:MoaA/NifB/PqqE/SkfB family radical SAM enzyme